MKTRASKFLINYSAHGGDSRKTPATLTKRITTSKIGSDARRRHFLARRRNNKNIPHFTSQFDHLFRFQVTWSRFSNAVFTRKMAGFSNCQKKSRTGREDETREQFLAPRSQFENKRCIITNRGQVKRRRGVGNASKCAGSSVSLFGTEREPAISRSESRPSRGRAVAYPSRQHPRFTFKKVVFTNRGERAL